MALTKKEKDEVYATAEIELLRTFERLSSLYSKPEKKDKARLMAEIERNVRKNLEQFKPPGRLESTPNSPARWFP